MSASEQTKDEAKREPDVVETRKPVERQPDDSHELPLFLRGQSDGHKGDAQDEKNAVGE